MAGALYDLRVPPITGGTSHHLFLQQNQGWFRNSGTGLPGLSWKLAVKTTTLVSGRPIRRASIRRVVCVCVLAMYSAEFIFHARCNYRCQLRHWFWFTAAFARQSMSIHRIPSAPCGLWGCKNRPALFPGRMSYKATVPGLICLSYLSMFVIMLLFIRAPFYVLLYCKFSLLCVLPFGCSG